MKLCAFWVVLAVSLAPVAVGAEVAVPQGGAVTQADPVAALSDILQIGPVIEVMRAEGVAYGAEMAAEMFPGQDGASWQAMVAVIYDPTTMRARFDAAFRTALAGSQQVDEITRFFGSDLGQRLLTLEVEARRALLDDAAEEAARLGYAEMQAAGVTRLQTLQAFVTANDLVDSNVSGAMNANMAFYRGMAEVGDFAEAMPEDQMLAEVWASEPDLRAETEDWLFPYLALAYKPVSDADLQTYVDFSASPAGQAANAALFAAFDVVFVALSRDLGRAAATQMQGQEL